MREFKFRVWDKELKRFNSPNVHHLDKNNEIMSIVLNIDIKKIAGEDRFVIQQYTGLDDFWGKEIYEGDILTSPVFNDFRFLYRVEFYQGSFLKPYIFRQMADGEPEVVGRANNNIDFNILTVVGNIFCDEFKMLD